MKRTPVILAMLMLVTGCGGSDTPPAPSVSGGAIVHKPVVQTTLTPDVPTTSASQDLSASPAIATVNGTPITTAQLEKPLIDAYGLNMLLQLVQLELAKQDAGKAGMTVTKADFDQELVNTLRTLVPNAMPDEYPEVIRQILSTQHLTRAEFDLVVQTNTYLRKIAEPTVSKWITEDKLREAFNTTYGEQVQVRHIQVANVHDAVDAKNLLATEPFEQVAAERSQNARTRAVGGELPPFSLSNPNIPEAFKNAAFALKVGEVSDPVEADSAFHIIKLEKRIAPKIVKFDDVRESVRLDLVNKATQATVKQLRTQLAQQAMVSMKIVDPGLKAQFEERMAEGKAQAKVDQEAELRRDIIRKAQDGTMSGKRPTTQGARPPATMSGSVPLSDTPSTPVVPTTNP